MPGLDYDIARLDFLDDTAADRRAGYVRAIHRGFLLPRPDATATARYAECVAADGGRTTGAWLPASAFGSGPEPVATYRSFDGTLNTGAALIPAWMITDVTVSPSHRRRGLLTRLMSADLEEAVAAQAPIAALTASEGAIYGRFGFGPATYRAKARVDLGPRFALREEIAELRVEIVPGDLLGTIPEDDFALLHRRTRGSISRPAQYRPWVRGEYDPDTGKTDDKITCAVALDADEQPVGHVTWKNLGEKNGRQTIEVIDLIGRTPRAHLALWHFVAGIDLVEVAEASMGTDDPLRWALVDPRVVRYAETEDLLWLRILDVEQCLTARRWHGEGQLTLEVTDRLGHAEGVWTITVTGGRAAISPAAQDKRAQLTLGVDALSALYLGGVDARTLAAAGRIDGDEEATSRLAGLLGDARPPTTDTFF